MVLEVQLYLKMYLAIIMDFLALKKQQVILINDNLYIYIYMNLTCINTKKKMHL